ncbi:MAG: type II toxin-antitoxin system VapC family toxin [Armatimonadetes bacterium]|nr:type II toxin-antitoxin system VapC family toxin [Armatimonadota bacterium]
MKIFVDTSGFYALASESDSFHRAAAASYEKVLEKHEPATTSYVVTETAALLKSRGGRAVASTFVASVRDGSWLEVFWVTENLHNEGCEIFLKGRADISLVDAVSFATMRHYGITHFLGFDRHFAREGFREI